MAGAPPPASPLPKGIQARFIPDKAAARAAGAPSGGDGTAAATAAAGPLAGEVDLDVLSEQVAVNAKGVCLRRLEQKPVAAAHRGGAAVRGVSSAAVPASSHVTAQGVSTALFLCRAPPLLVTHFNLCPRPCPPRAAAPARTLPAAGGGARCWTQLWHWPQLLLLVCSAALVAWACVLWLD